MNDYTNFYEKLHIESYYDNAREERIRVLHVLFLANINDLINITVHMRGTSCILSFLE